MSATSTPIDEWNPPTRKMDGGGIVFDNWQSIVACIDHAYTALGRTYSKAEGFPVDDWNLAGLAINYYCHASRATCCKCRARLWPMDTIRCLDCKAAICASCAPKHFWPPDGVRKALTQDQIRIAFERALEVGAPGIGPDIRAAILQSAMMRLRAGRAP